MNNTEQMYFHAEKNNVQVFDYGSGHYLLKGLLAVHYYPQSKNRTAYVAATVGSIKHISPKQAIEMCFKLPNCTSDKKAKRRKNYKRIREVLFNRGHTVCEWCENPLTPKNSTIEHIIPLKVGGLDHENNMTLACKSCNEKRGSSMPELFGE